MRRWVRFVCMLACIGFLLFALTACNSIDGMTSGTIIYKHFVPHNVITSYGDGSNWQDYEVQLAGDWDGVATKCWLLVKPEAYQRYRLGQTISVFDRGVVASLDGNCA